MPPINQGVEWQGERVRVRWQWQGRGWPWMWSARSLDRRHKLHSERRRQRLPPSRPARRNLGSFQPTGLRDTAKHAPNQSQRVYREASKQRTTHLCAPLDNASLEWHAIAAAQACICVLCGQRGSPTSDKNARLAAQQHPPPLPVALLRSSGPASYIPTHRHS
jgi:hypothetical protein